MVERHTYTRRTLLALVGKHRWSSWQIPEDIVLVNTRPLVSFTISKLCSIFVLLNISRQWNAIETQSRFQNDFTIMSDSSIVNQQFVLESEICFWFFSTFYLFVKKLLLIEDSGYCLGNISFLILCASLVFYENVGCHVNVLLLYIMSTLISTPKWLLQYSNYACQNS